MGQPQSETFEPAEPVPAGRHALPVTPWRQRLRYLSSEIVATIKANADPEEAYRAARETADDQVYEVKRHLRAEFGRTFDPILDGTMVGPHTHPAVVTPQFQALMLVRTTPGIDSKQLAKAIYGKANAGTPPHLSSLMSNLGDQVRHEGSGTTGDPYRWFPT